MIDLVAAPPWSPSIISALDANLQTYACPYLWSGSNRLSLALDLLVYFLWQPGSRMAVRVRVSLRVPVTKVPCLDRLILLVHKPTADDIGNA